MRSVGKIDIWGSTSAPVAATDNPPPPLPPPWPQVNVLEPASALARSPAGAGGLAGWDAEATGLALEREGMAEARALFNRMALRQGGLSTGLGARDRPRP